MSSYGLCPQCGASGELRERRPNGNDTCARGHVYPSRNAICVGTTPPTEAARPAGSNLVLEKNPAKLAGFTFDLPGRETVVGGSTLTWAQWADYHRRLGQELAKRMRVYPGPSTDPDGGDIGGTPAAMPARMAA